METPCYPLLLATNGEAGFIVWGLLFPLGGAERPADCWSRRETRAEDWSRAGGLLTASSGESQEGAQHTEGGSVPGARQVGTARLPRCGFLGRRVPGTKYWGPVPDF